MCGIGTVNSNDWEVAVLRHGVEGVAPLLLLLLKVTLHIDDGGGVGWWWIEMRNDEGWTSQVTRGIARKEAKQQNKPRMG